MFILADQPFLTPDLINRLIEAHRATSCLVARPVFKDRPGHPVLFDASLTPELLTLKGDTSVREVAARNCDRTVLVPVADEKVLLDVDTPEDYRRLRDFSRP
ncbi:MAG: NTP transferase domain-containing protein [Bacillota bacterium]